MNHRHVLVEIRCSCSCLIVHLDCISSAELTAIADLTEGKVKILTVEAHPIANSLNEVLFLFCLLVLDLRLIDGLFRLGQMFRLPIKILLGLSFATTIALDSPTEVIVLTHRADPASIWKIELHRLLLLFAVLTSDRRLLFVLDLILGISPLLINVFF